MYVHIFIYIPHRRMHIFSHTCFPSSHHGTCSCSFSGSKFSPNRGNSTSHQIMSAKFLETFQKKWPLGWGSWGRQENRRRCNGFNKVSLPSWWLIDIFWHLLPSSAVIDSSYRLRSRKGWGCGIGHYWLVLRERASPGDCSAVATRNWTFLSQRLPFLTPIQARGHRVQKLGHGCE